MKSICKLFFVFGIFFSSYINAQQLLANFPFSSNAQDIGGNNVSSILIGNANVSNSSLNIGYNTSDYLLIGPSALNNLNDFSVSLKVKFNSFNLSGTSAANCIFNVSNQNNLDRFGLSYNKTWNAFVGVVNGVGYNFTPISLPNPNTWYCLTLTREGNVMKIYVDGVLLGSQTCSSLPLIVSSIILGQEEDCYQGCFAANQSLNGSVKDLKFYSGSLNANQVSAMCCSLSFTQPTSAVGNIGSSTQFTIGSNLPSYTYQWQTNFGLGFQNLININQYSQVNTSTLNISNIQLNNHNQPFRVIVNNSSCIDTSNVVSLSISDTCINTQNIVDTTYLVINDTNFVNVIDTSYLNIVDTSYVTVVDTNYISLIDTTFITITDTNFVNVTDTIFYTVFDTSYVTIYDTITVVITGRMDENSNNLNQIKIYPNPSRDNFFVEVRETKENTQLIITNKLGEVVDKRILNSSITQISKLPSMAAGIYTFTFVSSNGETVSKKLILTD